MLESTIAAWIRRTVHPIDDPTGDAFFCVNTPCQQPATFSLAWLIPGTQKIHEITHPFCSVDCAVHWMMRVFIKPWENGTVPLEQYFRYCSRCHRWMFSFFQGDSSRPVMVQDTTGKTYCCFCVGYPTGIPERAAAVLTQQDLADPATWQQLQWLRV